MGRDMCRMHYMRWWRTGDPGTEGRKRIVGDDEARFWSKVDRRGEGECWLWTGTKTSSRQRENDLLYGIISINRRPVRAHRFAYELLVGPIPRDKELDHLCRNTLCVNPAHLEPVSHRENTARGEAARINAAREMAKTHCKRGHEFTPENTMWSRTKHGCGWQRQCRACMRLRSRKYAAKRKKGH
jgi:hypothetical protein